jgi:DNA-binding MarR family transcriptional regulator
MIGQRQSLFGTSAQTKILMLVVLLEETYPRELSRLATTSVGSVSKYLDKLELQGVTVSRYIGKERRVTLNPRFIARKQLADLVVRLSEAEPEILAAVRSVRRRPRRRGKEI